MGIFDNVTSSISNDIAKKLSNNYSEIWKDSKIKKFKLSIQEIKDSRDVYCDYFDYAKKLGLHVDGNKRRQRYIKSIFDETNDFYKTSIKTSMLKSLEKKLRSKVINDLELHFRNEKVDISELKIKNGNVVIDFNDIITSLILYDEVNIKIDIVDNTFNFIVIEPYRFYKKEDETIIFFKDKEQVFAEARTNDKIKIYQLSGRKFKLVSEEPTKQSFIYYYKTDMNIVKDGVLEKVLVDSELDSSIQKEIKLGTITNFIADEYMKGFNELREHYVVVSTPETQTLDTSVKPLFETTSPTLRFNDYQVAKQMLKEDISTLMEIDTATLGLVNETATAVATANSQSVNTINSIRKQIETVINNLLKDFFLADDYVISLNSYVITDEKGKTDTLSKQVSAGIATIETAVRALNNFNTEDEILTEVFTIMYQRGIPFTAEQEKEAKRLKILTEDLSTQTEGIDGSIL